MVESWKIALESRVARLLEHENLVRSTNHDANASIITDQNQVINGPVDSDQRTRQLSRDVERLTHVLARRTASHAFEVSRFQRQLEEEEERMVMNAGRERQAKSVQDLNRAYNYVLRLASRCGRVLARFISPRGLKLLCLLWVTAWFARRVLLRRRRWQ